MIRLVLSDIDGTLVDTPRSTLTDRAARAALAVLGAGAVFGPCTGRPRPYLPDLFGPGREALFASGVFDNGMVAYLGGERVFERTYDPAALAALALWLGREGSAELWVCGLDPADPRAFTVVDAPWLLRHGEGALAGLTKANIHFGAGADLDAEGDALSREFPDLDFVSPTRGRPLLDVLARGCSKAVGARALAGAVGASADEVLVFGDSDNDLEVLGAFPNSVAVADAKPRVAACARWHVGPCAEDGVAEALEALAARLETHGSEAAPLG